MPHTSPPTSPPPERRRRVLATTAAAALVLAGSVLAGCSSGTAAPATTTTTVPPTTTTTTEQPGWTVVARANGAIAVDTETVTEASGHTVTIYRFRAGQTHLGLHVGSSDPPRGDAVVSADSGPAIGPDETASLLAAFNGGFESSAGAGGFELNGQVLVPLQVGYASLVIDADGTGHVGVWGQTVPAKGEQVASVRQNLPPLVVGGQPSPNIADVAAWGATLGGGSSVPRSALGEDPAGDLLFAGSMSALPSDLAGALVSAGTTTAMELDINPEWVQIAVAPAPGGTLATGIPGQNRPANQYVVGWTRDFVTVLAAG